MAGDEIACPTSYPLGRGRRNFASNGCDSVFKFQRPLKHPLRTTYGEADKHRLSASKKVFEAKTPLRPGVGILFRRVPAADESGDIYMTSSPAVS